MPCGGGTDRCLFPAKPVPAPETMQFEGSVRKKPTRRGTWARSDPGSMLRTLDNTGREDVDRSQRATGHGEMRVVKPLDPRPKTSHAVVASNPVLRGWRIERRRITLGTTIYGTRNRRRRCVASGGVGGGWDASRQAIAHHPVPTRHAGGREPTEAPCPGDRLSSNGIRRAEWRPVPAVGPNGREPALEYGCGPARAGSRETGLERGYALKSDDGAGGWQRAVGPRVGGALRPRWRVSLCRAKC